MLDFIFKQSRFLLFGLLTAFFASYGQTFFISLFNFQIRDSLNITNASFGLIYSAATILSSILLIWFGKLIDKIDLRLFTLIVSIGLSISCFGMYLLKYSPHLIFFVIFGLRFFGQGAMGHTSQTSMARYYNENRGKAISFGSFGQPIGEMILPIIVVIIIKFSNWESVWLYAGTSIIIIFIPLYSFLLKDQAQRHKNFLEQQNKNNSAFDRRDVLKDPRFYIYLPSYLMPPFLVTGLLFYQMHIANEKSWSLELVATSFVFYGIFSVIGLIIGGPLVDKFKTRKIIPTYLIPMFIGIMLLAFRNEPIIMIIYMSLISFSTALAIPFMGSLWAELYGVLNLGSIRSLLHAIGVFSTAISPFLFGLFIDWGLGIMFICFFSLILIGISTLLTFFYMNYR
ncbi:MAG: hypothetical protein CFH21_00866 [Alphaproteobacteria bacterium MarineAlpha5_Bin11]|nr:MAG: hypothetical protein CFH21_00866 [Alphaproteobacteria bacterium MarineAlpha5_Bin11]